jgi:hypothetical protein
VHKLTSPFLTYCFTLFILTFEQASVATEDGLVADDHDFNDDDTATYALSDATLTVSARWITKCVSVASNHYLLDCCLMLCSTIAMILCMLLLTRQ